MRMRRCKQELTDAAYHVFSRVVDRQFKFDDGVKDDFKRLLWQVATFSGVEIITYALMSDHFHVLVRVHPRWTHVDENEVVKRVGILYGGLKKQWLKNKLAYLREAGDEVAVEALLGSYRVRMNNISEFMKTLKLRMTIGFNMAHDREGTLWEGRFHSVLLEDGVDSKLLRIVAAYIDLNPVRAGMTGHPGSYRWCGYANAKGGGCWAEQGEKGIAFLFSHQSGSALRNYNEFLCTRMAKKGIGALPKASSGLCPLMDVHVKNDVLIRSRAIGGRDFIFNVAGNRPAGGVTSFTGSGEGPFLAVGRLTRRARRA